MHKPRLYLLLSLLTAYLLTFALDYFLHGRMGTLSFISGGIGLAFAGGALVYALFQATLQYQQPER